MTVPERLTIIPVDGLCSVNGYGFFSVDMTSLPPEIHAVQWYGTHGEVEIKDPITNKMVRNDVISSLDQFKSVIDSYWTTRNAYEAEQAALAAVEQQLQQFHLQEYLQNLEI